MKDTSIVPYTLLALEVILQAIEDATKEVADGPPETADKHQLHDWNCARNDRDQARLFLTVSNEELLFWCRVAGINHRALLHYAKGASADWAGLKARLHNYRRAPKKDEDELTGAAA